MTGDTRYLALDPGETTGWAKFDAEGIIQGMGQFKLAEQTKWLNDNITPDLAMVIIEDYKNYSWKEQKKWSRNQTSKNIGAIEMCCELRGVPYTLQDAQYYVIGLKYAKLGKLPSNHAISHQYVAVAHGTYWLRVNGILIPTE